MDHWLLEGTFDTSICYACQNLDLVGFMNANLLVTMMQKDLVLVTYFL